MCIILISTRAAVNLCFVGSYEKSSFLDVFLRKEFIFRLAGGFMADRIWAEPKKKRDLKGLALLFRFFHNRVFVDFFLFFDDLGSHRFRQPYPLLEVGAFFESQVVFFEDGSVDIKGQVAVEAGEY